jgi:TRAP-type C4-dicarboxylate transport system permease large subunit
MMGVLPFIVSLMLMILIVIAFPEIVLWVPRIAGAF